MSENHLCCLKFAVCLKILFACYWVLTLGDWFKLYKVHLNCKDMYFVACTSNIFLYKVEIYRTCDDVSYKKVFHQKIFSRLPNGVSKCCQRSRKLQLLGDCFLTSLLDSDSLRGRHFMKYQHSLFYVTFQIFPKMYP